MEPGAPDIQDFVVVEDEDLDEYSPDIPPQTPEVIDKIKTWLQPTDFLAESSEYNKHLHNHLAGTGLWMQETESYRRWHDSPQQGSLWIKAIAGAGKSVFAAMIAEQLARVENVPVLSFFFRQIVATNHHPQSLVRDWLAMILGDSPPLQARMKKHLDDRRNLESVTTNELWQDLVHALVSMPKVYLVIDALDEMDLDQQEFFTNLVKLGKRKPSSIKLLITSRPLPRIEAYMKDPSILQIRLEQAKVDGDIAIYVGHRIDREKDVSLELRTAIKVAVGEKAQGSFLYARLMMDELLDHLQQMTPDLASIRRSLGWLPSSLEDMYNGMLLDHSLRSSVPQDLQLTILLWVTHSTRPLRLLELASMIDAQTSSPKQGKRRDTKAIVRAACGPLLEILEDETVSVIHHSFTEFLTDVSRAKKQPSSDYPQFPVIIPAITHKRLAMTCLDYLSRCLIAWELPAEIVPNMRDGSYRPIVQKPIRKTNLKMEEPFLEYASNNWYVHARGAESIDQELISKLDEFMNSEKHDFNAWVDMVWPNSRGKLGLLPLHISAWAGLVSYTRHLLLRTADSDPLDGRRRTPLSYAAAKGYADVVAILLEHVKDPNVDCYNGLKAIHYAAQGNHYKVVRLLLQAGVSPLTGKTKDPGRRCGNSPSSIGHTPLMYACQAGGVESVREMISESYGYLKTEDLTRALCWAAEAGKTEVVDLILGSLQISVDGPENSTTALFLASSGLHFEVMRSLLKAGADANRRCMPRDRYHMRSQFIDETTGQELGPTPLHALCGEAQHSRYGTRPDEETLARCFSLLMDAGCDINSLDSVGKTPLHYSTGRNMQETAMKDVLSTLLLQNGADPRKCDKSGNTPLHLLKLHQRPTPLIQLFIDKGADIYARRKTDGRTPVHLMMDNIHKIDIGSLLPHVSNWNIQDNEGNTPLHIFLSKSYQPDSCIQDLLNAGADLGLKNRKGEAPHLLVREVSRGSSQPILPQLIAGGADLESRDNDGRTLLLRTLNGHATDAKKAIQTLQELGADLKVVDNDGNGCLHTVCARTRDPSAIKHLVESGVDPLARNHAGDSLLHEALKNFNTDYEKLENLINTLCELGVSTSARNLRLRTPLHVAFERMPAVIYGAKLDPLDFILGSKIGEEINSMDIDGLRPLHLAATLSEQLVAKLIHYGADPLAETYECKNVLHIAARTKMTNVIGFLLEHFTSKSKEYMINAVDNTGRSPLHYACRSGRPETVALLLESGADPNLSDKYGCTPLHACAEFEQEKLLWVRADSPIRDAVLASGILNSDLTRPVDHNSNNHSGLQDEWGSVSCEDDAGRIGEIVRMLLNHGAELIPQINKASVNPFNYAIRCGCSEMVDELNPLMEKAAENAGSTLSFISRRAGCNFKRRSLLNDWNVSILPEDILENEDNTYLCNILLVKRRYNALRTLPAMGIDFTPQTDRPDFMTTLAQYGYAELFKQLGASIKKQGWVNGLYSANHTEKKTVMPYLITAVRRSLPNLEVMRAIVEKFGADVNIQPEVMINTTANERTSVLGSSALHILAAGENWWKTKGIEYLLRNGADVNLRNERGETPLAIAVGNSQSIRKHQRFHNAKLLLQHGADPNLLDSAGLSCLTKAINDVKLVRLLIEHGADITLGAQPVLLAAIAAMDITAVSVILESGANCNVKRKTPTEDSKLPRQRLAARDYDYFPLHFAASCKFNEAKTRSTAIQIIKLLLANGANVFLRYDSEDTVSKGGTIIHDIFRSGGILQPFLEIPDLDLEHRDQNGNTLILAAASSNAGTSSTAPIRFGIPQLTYEERANLRAIETAGDPPPSYTIYNLGGDLTAVNNGGNNVLHILTGVTPHNDDEYRKAFSAFIAAAPELVDMPNKDGATPLHFALQNGRWWAVQTLLDAGANPLLPDAGGNTPLHYVVPLVCSSNGSDEKLGWLHKFLAQGVSINTKNNLGETPLFAYFAAASPYGNGASAKQSPHAHRRLYVPIHEAGADISTRNNEGQTLLHVIPKQSPGPFPMTIGSDEEMVDSFKFLMEMGVDPMAEDKCQRTALDVAAVRGKQNILDLFKRENNVATGAILSAVPPIVPIAAAAVVQEDSEDDW